MAAKEYYVIEDFFFRPTADIIAGMVAACDKLGFRVDSKFADAFGINVTSAPNGWLVKQEKPQRPSGRAQRKLAPECKRRTKAR